MKWMALALLVLLASCASGHELPHTSKSDPVWQLNPDKWAFNENDLKVPVR